MKVRTLLNEINRLKDVYEDFLDWEVFTEQEHLVYPEDKEEIDRQILAGWRFVYDSEGWVYKDCASFKDADSLNFTIFEKEKVFTINNNY